MYFDTVADYWNSYASRELIRTIHPADDMYNKSVTESDYWGVGKAGLSVIASALSLSRLRQVRRVLDFGCGHGRVARHLHAFFPKATLFFCDIDETASQFCAETFNGEAVRAEADFAILQLPPDLDIIWLGSVFTHLSYKDMETLFDSLYRSLAPGGALIITYRGRQMYERMRADHPNLIKKWSSLLSDYERTGIAFQAYGPPDPPNWGLSLNSMESMLKVGLRHEDARMLCLSESGWAVSHDVIAWTRRIPSM